MKKYILPLVILFCGTIFLSSCKKPGHDTKYYTLNETVLSGSTYTLDLSAYGDADDRPAVTTQAANYIVSQVGRDAVSAKNIYSFSSSSKSGDKETVVITLTEDHGGRGGPCNHDAAVITINFTVN